jgi:hypothetical protein
MTLAPFWKEQARKELAKLRAITNVKLSSQLGSRMLKCVTISCVYTFFLKAERFQRSHVGGDG